MDAGACGGGSKLTVAASWTGMGGLSHEHITSVSSRSPDRLDTSNA